MNLLGKGKLIGACVYAFSSHVALKSAIAFILLRLEAAHARLDLVASVWLFIWLRCLCSVGAKKGRKL